MEHASNLTRFDIPIRVQRVSPAHIGVYLLKQSSLDETANHDLHRSAFKMIWRGSARRDGCFAALERITSCVSDKCVMFSSFSQEATTIMAFYKLEPTIKSGWSNSDIQA